MRKRWKHRTLTFALGVLGLFAACTGGVPDCPVDDHNPCTLDTCNAGNAINDQLDDGHPCFVGQLKGACQAGVCNIACVTSAQCDDALPCTSGTCTNGACVMKNVDQTLPSDGNSCVERGCVDGETVTWPKQDGALCAGERTCTNGLCSCETAIDCGFDTECRLWDCVKGACKPLFIAFDTNVSTGDFDGDCRRPICDGQGGVRDAEDPADKPIDFDPCYEWRCIGMTPLRTPIIGKPCVMDSGFVGHCSPEGTCLQCIQDLDCTPDARCLENVCQTCGDAFPNGTEICGGSCGACIGTSCTDDSGCAGGHCVGTNSNPPKICCDAPCDGVCQECGDNGKCTAVETGYQDADTCYFPDMACVYPQCRFKTGHPCVFNTDCVSNTCLPNTKTCK